MMNNIVVVSLKWYASTCSFV